MSDFSTDARQEAEQPDKIPIALMSGEQMVNLLIEHDIGVARTSYDLIELQGGWIMTSNCDGINVVGAEPA